MTDRHSGYFVILGEDVREDDAEQILTALSMVKGVLTVTAHVSDPTTAIARARAKLEMEQVLRNALEGPIPMTNTKADTR